MNDHDASFLILIAGVTTALFLITAAVLEHLQQEKEFGAFVTAGPAPADVSQMLREATEITVIAAGDAHDAG